MIEIGAGTGSATASVLPELPEGGYDYVYTDISAGFFAEAESRFGGAGASIDYRVLDIEKDPVEQGFDRHGYDLVIASNVLHATRYLNETLAHCLALLAPAGQLVALENLRGQGWLDLTFGQLDGWWRFADDYRPHHALATPAVWRRALGDAGFGDIAILGFDESDPDANPDRGVILARGPAAVTEAPGLWLLAADRGGLAAELAAELAAHNQTVVLAGEDAGGVPPEGAGVAGAPVEAARRESWQSVLDGLPAGPPLAGVVHLAGLDGHGARATTEEMAADARHAAASALALTQALAASDLAPSKGFWLITRGAQVLERERGGELAGATLWGLGKVAAREAPGLRPRMLDLDPGGAAAAADLVNELLHPDAETHVAYRFGRRQAARLVRAAAVAERLTLPEEPGWTLEPDAGGSLDAIRVAPDPQRPLEPGQVRAAIEAFGLNFRDVFIAIGLVDDFMGGEFCGRVLEVGEGVTGFAAGDRVVGMTFRNFGAETVTREEMIVPAPPGFSTAELATIPTAFVSAALSFDLSGLNAGDRVLIHAGAGGVGLAAIQLARAAGAEVFATASARKRAYLRSLGVEHVFDSRTTAFGEEILEATGGAGVDVVLNSLTGEGFIEASLSCLAGGGRFVEMGRVDILSEDEMAAARPDVSYAILKIDVLKEEEPARAGEILRRVMARLEAGELTPLVHARWPVAETGPAMKCMQGARHIGKIVLANSPLARGRLREDRSYLGDRRARRHRRRGGRLAGGPRRRRHRAQRPAAARSRGRGGHRGVAQARRRGAGGARRRDQRRRDRRDAGADGRGPAAARGRDPQRWGAGRRHHRQPELGDVRDGAVAEDAGGLAPAPGDRRARPRHVRALLQRRRRSRQPGPGQPRGGQRLPRPACRPSPRAGAPRPSHRLGRMVGDRRSRRAAGADGPGAPPRAGWSGSRRSRASGPSTGWCARTPRAGWCWRATGRPSANPWRAVRRCWRTFCRRAPTTAPTSRRARTCFRGCGRPRRRRAGRCSRRSSRVRSRRC